MKSKFHATFYCGKFASNLLAHYSKANSKYCVLTVGFGVKQLKCGRIASVHTVGSLFLFTIDKNKNSFAYLKGKIFLLADN